MKETPFTEALSEAIALKLRAMDLVIENFVEPMAEVGNPEQLIGRPYETWTMEDFEKLKTIYGQSPDSPLTKFIFNKEYTKLRELEAEV